MNKIRRKIIIIVSILIIVSLSSIYLLQGFVSYSEDVFWHKRIINAFYNEEENSLDCVYIGPSSVTRYWIPALAFNEHGITVSNVATTGQPFVLVKYLVQETRKTQEDAIFIIEFRNVFKEPDDLNEINIRRVTDNLKPSLTRLQAVNAGLEYMYTGDNEVVGNTLGVYFPALESLKRKIKGTLTEKVSFRGPTDESTNKGFLISPSSFQQNKVPESKYNISDTAPLDPIIEEALYDLLDYCDSIDNDVLFVLSPYSAGMNTYPKVNTAIGIIEDRGYTVLNMNTEEMIEDLNIDWEKDFYNRKHTNCLGAEKYTNYLAEYLVEHYDLEDHRNDPVFNDWHESWQVYVERTKEQKRNMNK